MEYCYYKFMKRELDYISGEFIFWKEAFWADHIKKNCENLGIAGSLSLKQRVGIVRN